jgi:hypothetical protein
MSGNTILDSMNKKESVAIEKMLQALKVLGGNNNASQALLAEAERELKHGNEPTRLTGNIEFECPQYTLRAFLNQLRVDSVKAQYGTHYREINGRTEINIEKESYIIDENEKGSIAVDELRARNGKATEAEIDAAYNEGCERARRHNRKAKTVEPNWVMAEKDGENDTREEDTNIRYVDNLRTRIDWYVSIRNLAAYGKRSGYNMNHYKRCIDRWVSFFSPHLRPVTDSQSANEAASYLSVLTLPDSDVEIVEREINKMVRQPGEKLVSVMSNLRALANVMYKEYDQLERDINVERTLLQGIITMTAGKTRLELEAALLEKKRRKEKINWSDLLDGVVRSEEIHGMPREPLFFSGVNADKPRSILNFNVNTKLVDDTVGCISPLVNTSLSAPRVNKKQTSSLVADIRIPPPVKGKLELSREDTLGSFLQYRSIDNEESVLDSSEEQQTMTLKVNERGNIEVSREEMESLIENISRISASDKTMIDNSTTESSDPTPGQSTPMVDTATRKSSRAINPPARFQAGVNNVQAIEVLATRTAELLEQRFKGKFDKDKKDKKDKSKDKKSDRKSRKDKYEDKNKKRDGSKTRSDSKKSDRSKSRTSQASSKSRESSRNSSKSSNGRSLSNTRERKKTWSDSDFKNKRGMACSRDYNPKRQKRCLKCMTEESHHEFQCKKYLRRSKYACRNCKQGFHFEEECKEPRRRSESRNKNNNNKGN